MKLTNLHEAWNWKQFGKGTLAGAAIGGAAIMAGRGNRVGPGPTITPQAKVTTPRPASPPTPVADTPYAPVPEVAATSPPSASPSATQDNQLSKEFGDELPIIRKAAERNGCQGDLFYVLLAIRKSENGASHEFGILTPGVNGLDAQAGWSAATIVKNHQRWEKAGKPGEFISFLGSRYCPVGASNDPTGLNRNWVKNVTHWYQKLRGL